MESTSAEANDTVSLLLVDPDESNLDALEGFSTGLFHGRCRVLRARSGEEALAALRGEDVSVLLSEERLPGMTGVEMFRQARRLQPDAVRVLLTEAMDEGALVEAINTGRVYRYVPKPWSRPDLEECLRNALDWRQHGRRMRRLLDEQRRAHLALSESLAALERTQQQMVHVERLATVGRLTSGIIHEVRNQLTALLGVFATLRAGEGRIPELAMGGYRIVKRLIARMSTIQSFARAGGWSYEMDETRLGALVDHLRSLYELEVDESSLPVEVTPEDAERVVRADGAKLVHALVAVVREAQERFRTPLALRVRTDRRGGVAFRFFVVPGQPGEGDGRRTTPPPERDPSLEVVRMIAEAHGGTLRLAPREEPGIWATLTLPPL